MSHTHTPREINDGEKKQRNTMKWLVHLSVWSLAAWSSVLTVWVSLLFISPPRHLPLKASVYCLGRLFPGACHLDWPRVQEVTPEHYRAATWMRGVTRI